MSEVFDNMLNQVMSNVYATKLNNSLIFESTDGKVFEFTHYQNCCEQVVIEDITGDLSDLVGSPLLMAEKFTSEDPKYQEGYRQYTFYKFATIKGYVTVRWVGSTDSCYSLEVSYVER